MAQAVILHGVTQSAPNPDDADTLIQADEIAAALGRLGYATRVVAVGRDLSVLDTIADERPAIVFNLVETMDGRGCLAHVAPMVLDELRLPYTGCPAHALMTTTDKLLTKAVLVAHGLPTPDWVGSRTEPAASPAARYIVKAVSEDASIGIDAGSVVAGDRVRGLIAAKTARFGGAWFAERYVEGREFNVAVIAGPGGPEVLPVAEMTFVDFPDGRPRIVDYEAKWDDTSHAFHNTPRRFDLAPGDGALVEELRRLALAAWSLFGLAGYARIDFRVDEAGCPTIIEINGNPCLSADAGFMAAAGLAGLAQTDVVKRVVDAALASGARTASDAA